MTVPQKKGEEIAFVQDEPIRPDTSLDKLARLKPAFSPDGTITAGNAPGINDGAAALVVMSEAAAERRGVTPLARIVSWAAVSAEPPDLGTVPALAARWALEKAGLQPGDIDLVEINEAFATVVLVSLKIGGFSAERTNVNGGAIALGHPIGASGARILLTLAIEMQLQGSRYGVAAICSGGGQGEATVLERVAL